MNGCLNTKKKAGAVAGSMTALLLLLLVAFHSALFVNEIPYYTAIGFILVLFVYEIQTIVIVFKKIKTARPQQIVSLYMMLKVIKIFIFLATLAIYLLAVKIESQRFVLVLVAIYFFYLLFDTCFLTAVEKREKKE
jgi:hypothetical protein